MPLKSTTLVAFTEDGFKKVNTNLIVELNSQGKIPSQYLDLSDLKFMGVYDAENNVPVISDDVGSDNEYYIVNVAGTNDFGSGSLVMKDGDTLIYFENKWNLISEDKINYNNSVQNIPLENSDLHLPANTEFNVIEEYEDVNFIFDENSTISPIKNTLKNVDFTVTTIKKHTTDVDPDWFTGSDSDKIESAFKACKKFLGAAIRLNRDYYLDRTVVLEGGSVHILGNGFPNFFRNVNDAPLNTGREFDKNYNTSRLIANSPTIDKLLWIKGSNFGSYTACSVWIEGVCFTKNTGNPSIPYYNADGIYIDTANGPTRPFNIIKCNFFGLKNGIHVNSLEGSYSTSVGAISIRNNNFHGNDWAVKAEGLSAVLNFDFSNNNAEQNRQGALDLYDDVSARVLNANINITNNLLEAQPIPIRIKASKSSITIENNYFEHPAGQKIIIYGSLQFTQVFFGRYYVTNDSKLSLEFYDVTYTMTSRIFDKQTKIKTANCLEMKNYNISYQPNGAVTSLDFDDIYETNPLSRFSLSPQYQYRGKFGITNGQKFSPTSTYTASVTINMVEGQRYLVSFLLKDLSGVTGINVKRKVRIRNITQSVNYDGLNSVTTMTPNNGNEYLVFAVFEHNLPSGSNTINLLLSGYDSVFDYETVVSRAAIFDYTNNIRSICPALSTFVSDPTFTSAEQGYTYYNSTTGKLRIWKNTAFVDLI